MTTETLTKLDIKVTASDLAIAFDLAAALDNAIVEDLVTAEVMS